MVHFFALALIGLLAFPQAAEATFDQLMGDVELMERDIDLFEQQQIWQEEDVQVWESEEIFSTIGTVSKQTEVVSPLEKQITIREGDTDIVLTDVPIDAWFAQYVQDAVDRGIITGYRNADGNLIGRFGPANNVTNEELAKIALETAELDVRRCARTPRNEGAIGSWSEAYVGCAEGLGWSVYTDGSIDVKQPATRRNVVVTMLQALDARYSGATGTVFTDVPASLEFSAAIEKAARDGVISGYANSDGSLTGEFGPYDTVTRAQMAKIAILSAQLYGD